jgi:hypothetical protein
MGLSAMLNACGDLPRPFMGNPGATAIRLSHPPPSRLAVPPPNAALLSNESSTLFANDVAKALADQSVPAFAGQIHKGDWRLVLTAEVRGMNVVPTYTVQNPDGTPQGSTSGVPVPASAWASGDEAIFTQAATAAAPNVASLLNRIEAAIQRNDPNSLVNRPARLQMGAITGAPGDGSTALARQLTLELTKLGEVVQDNAAGADFVVTCKVSAVPEGADTTRVEIQWIVTDAAGREAGRIVQINEIPSGTLDHYWGDVAVVVTQQAAGGIREVMLNQRADRQKPREVGQTNADTAPKRP